MNTTIYSSIAELRNAHVDSLAGVSDAFDEDGFYQYLRTEGHIRYTDEGSLQNHGFVLDISDEDFWSAVAKFDKEGN